MLKKNLSILFVAALLLTACASSRQSDSILEYGAPGDFGGGYGAPEMEPAYDVEEKLAFSDNAVFDDEAYSESRMADGSMTSAIERMVLKNAHLSIVVAEPSTTMDDIMHMADGMGGYVVSSNLWETTSYNNQKILQASVTIRVPSERLDEALVLIKDGAGKVTSESVSGEDVTTQYTDLSSRLRNLESAEEQLAKIMDRATKTEDVLRVYNQLVSVREQIEVIKGQMQYFEQAAALSSIDISITADEANRTLQIGNWEPVGVAKDAIEALFSTLQWLGNVVIWMLIYILPVGLLVGFPLRWAWRKLQAARQRGKDRRAAKKAANETKEA
ncbi:MAG: DUF4349 domain-containing protein [Chloroflexi bacterium]|nr:DUF4349 domain-containing protein [Chloroflexota bacterium]